MLFPMKASRWTKQNSRKFSIGHLQETSRHFNHSLHLPTVTAVSSRIILKKISSLTVFLKNNSCFPLNEEAIRQFHQLKEAFTIASILSHFYPSLPTIVKTDASDNALGAVLSHISDSGQHPIGFDSRRLHPAELNYKIHDRQLPGLFWALKHWRAFLLSLSSSFEVLTDHSSLQYFMSSKILTYYQSFWAELLSDFIFQSLTTLAAWPPFQIHCHIGTTFSQRGERFHQQESNELSKNNKER
ncbi:hypothetical protein O181_087879 [Austropuccinia psidii MF-1]|uniref:Reverse transcriptase/retrotransposon-derived protein RNase H-like domain-containing protein n=1 Tax=Austropuccinia psidii MF-1 TaxID=1389203 RepID=A0A9Q3P2G7_9BASI|nr:hypothetical protein [Austropuccinia psidii MF-1]